jgi:hypothetical protein
MNFEISHQIVFVDESWVFTRGSDTDVRSDGIIQCAKKRRQAPGTRYITMHAGTQNGFVSGASLIFVSGTNSGDYHEAMNGENCEHWVLTRLLPNLQGPSLIMMDMHNTTASFWRKDQIIAWLQEKRIPTPKGSFKAELLNLANAYKSPRKR